jgi:hypothetical protein
VEKGEFATVPVNLANSLLELANSLPY